MVSALDQYHTVSAAWAEGRLENVLQRQKELALLHANIKSSSTDLIEAICDDLQTSKASAAAEVQLALDSIKHLYDDLDFPNTLAKEKHVRKGASSSSNLIPLGPVLIDPSPYSPFLSVIAPLAAAVAAGSSAIVLATSACDNLDAELPTLINKSLDVEAFAITESDSAKIRRELSKQHFGAVALQNLSLRDDLFTSLCKTNPLIRVLSPPSGIPAAFVDRSVQDLEAVASHLVASGSRTPRYNPLRTPRLVFVDEIHITNLHKLIRTDTSADASLSFSDGEDKAQAFDKLLTSSFPTAKRKLPQHVSGHLPAVIALDNSDAIIAENVQKAAELLKGSHNGLLLVPTRSLDHGIDILGKINANNPSQATYIFASSEASSYVVMFTNTLQVFINTIPQWSLATVAPSTPFVENRLLYRKEDFSVNKPILQESIHHADSISSEKEPAWSFLSHHLQLDNMGLNAGSSLRRVVTHHKGESSAILSDEELKLIPGFGSNAVTIWRNDKYPAELVDKDPVGTDPVIYTPGSLIRVVDFPPNSSGHNHRTASLDYGIVFEGELEMVLADGSKTIVRAGDIIVQQAWNNLTDKPARLIFVLLPSEKTVDGVNVSEAGVPEKYLPKIS
ncbi:hypothetical protein FPCIR_13882 [Fusarium pseudocircinatum]|uniref:Aldehyde dehydrogenase domain-containing protein n=1 Tax=Fusarium pseudocircinatum TaxID=56676 RepID=A0A8H5KJ90_9HYPO|nr:hypothetical protein FPCIR_13882 [Fusarium pseudocircinatum]